MLAYIETIYLVGSQLLWKVSNEVAAMVALLREVKDRNRGRLRMSRYSYVGESRKRKNRYKKCGEFGHYQKNYQS